MNRLTFPELADVHLAYGAAGGNALAAQRLYRERHPGRDVPHRTVFVNVHFALRERGSFQVSASIQIDEVLFTVAFPSNREPEKNLNGSQKLSQSGPIFGLGVL